MAITGTSYFFDRSRDRMALLSQTADRLQQQVANGKRVSAPSDDSAAWQRLQSLSQAKADGTAYTGNITFARAVLAQTDSTLVTVQGRLQRATELTIQAKSGTLSAQDRSVIAEELDAIVADLTALGATNDGRGQPLFDASAASIPVADGITIAAKEDPTRVFGSIVSDLATYVTQLRTAGSAAAPAASATALTALGTATANLASVQGAVGARAARVELVSASTQEGFVNIETERGALEDTDLTSAITNLQKTMTVLSATQASFTKLTELSLFNYLR